MAKPEDITVEDKANQWDRIVTADDRDRGRIEPVVRDELVHGASPWCLPFGSGNPDRHGLIIADISVACRLIATMLTTSSCSSSMPRRVTGRTM